MTVWWDFEHSNHDIMLWSAKCMLKSSQKMLCFCKFLWCQVVLCLVTSYYITHHNTSHCSTLCCVLLKLFKQHEVSLYVAHYVVSIHYNIKSIQKPKWDIKISSSNDLSWSFHISNLHPEAAETHSLLFRGR